MGLKYAFGKYVLFLDSDDMFQNKTLYELLEIAKNEKVDIIYFDAFVFFMPGMKYNKNKVRYYKRKRSYGKMSGKDLFSKLILKERFSDSACLMMINRIWLNNNKIRFIEGILYEDSIFSIQIMMKAKYIYQINKQYYIYRIRNNSIMNSNLKPINLYSRLIGYKEFINIYKNEKLSNYQQKALFKYIKMRENNIRDLEKIINKNEWKLFCEKQNVSKYVNMLLILVSEIIPKEKRYKKSINLEKLWQLLSPDKIVIYGIGNLTFRLLDYYNLIDKMDCIKGILVPNLKSNISIINVKKIRILNEDKNIDKNETIIISENEKKKDEFKEMGYKNVIILDEYINHLIIILLNKLK